MKASYKQALRNERNLSIEGTGYGHWRIECDYRGKRISCTTTDSMAIDDFRSGEDDRIKAGYEALCSEIIDGNNNDKWVGSVLTSI